MIFFRALIYVLMTSIIAFNPVTVFGQRNRNWTFGESIFMTFDSVGPKVDTSRRSTWFFELTASISDKNGDYAYMASHNEIYDRENQPITAPWSGWQSNFSITQGVTMFPYEPSNKTICVWMGYNCPIVNSVCLQGTIIANELNEGKGRVIDPIIVLVDTIEAITEKLNVTKHSNGKDWWVLGHLHANFSWPGQKTYFRVLLNGSGFSAPTFQDIGSDITPNITTIPNSAQGELIFSEQGNRLVFVSGAGTIDLFKFNRCTGLLSDFRILGTPAIDLYKDNNYYGASFSSDGSKLYVSEANLSGSRIFQWDLSDTSQIVSSKTLIYQLPADSTFFGQHQIGPDGKIYMTTVNFDDSSNVHNFHLSVIHSPNAQGATCNFELDGVDLNGWRGGVGLPNMPNYNLGPERMVADCGPDISICFGDSVLLGVPDTSEGRVDFAWKPLRPSDGSVADSSDAQVWVSPTDTTIYILTVEDKTWNCPCSITTDTVMVFVLPASEVPQLNLGADQKVCVGDTLLLQSGTGVNANWSYLWNTGDTLAAISVHTPFGIGGKITSYYLDIEHSTGLACAHKSDTILVAWKSAPHDASLQDLTLCAHDPRLIGSLGLPGVAYLWSPTTGLDNSNTSQPLATLIKAQDYVVSLIAHVNPPACKTHQQSVHVSVLLCHLPTYLSATEPNLLIYGLESPFEIRVYDMQGRLVYASNDYKNGLNRSQLAPGLYYYIVQDALGVMGKSRLMVNE